MPEDNIPMNEAPEATQADGDMPAAPPQGAAPEDVRALLTDFESAFPTPQLQRAWDYWMRGAVTLSDKPANVGADVLGIGVVHWGNADYVVTVRQDATGEIFTQCSCGNAACRHAAAVLYQMRDGDHPAHTAADDVIMVQAVGSSIGPLADIPHEMYNALMEAIVAKHDSSMIEGNGPETFTLIWDSAWANVGDDRTPSDDTRLFSKAKAESTLRDALTSFTQPAEGQSAEEKAAQIRATPLAQDSPLFDAARTVLDNALLSAHWEEAVRNICTVINYMAQVCVVFNDSKHVARSLAHTMMVPVTHYMAYMSQEADPQVSGHALETLMKTATSDLVMHVYSGGIVILSCAIPFARWEDTKEWAFEALDTVDAAIGDDTSDEACNKRGFDIPWSRQRLLVIRHDIAALAGDTAMLDAMRQDNPKEVALQTIDLASALLRDDVDGAMRILRDVNSENEATTDAARQANEMLTMALSLNPNSELGMSGWLGVTEAVMQAAHDVEGLEQLYTNNILNATVKLGIRSAPRMRALVGEEAWPAKRYALIRECGRQLIQRRAMLDDLNERLKQNNRPPVPLVALRNPAYELLIIEQPAPADALSYIRITGAVSKDLLDTVAIDYPNDAAQIANQLHDAQVAQGVKADELIDTSEYDARAATDSAAATVDAILNAARTPGAQPGANGAAGQ